MEINLYLITVLVLMIGLTIIGAWRGFVKTVFATLGLVLVIALTGIFNPYIRAFLDNNTDMKQMISDKLANSLKIEETINPGISGLTVNDYVKDLDIPDPIKKAVVSVTKDKANAIDTVGQKTEEISIKTAALVYDGLAELVIGAISYLVTFCIASLIVIVVWLLLDIASKIPGLRQLNKLLGGLMGFVQGYLVVSLIYVIAVAFGSTSFGMSVLEMINESELLTWFYDNNIVVNLLLSWFVA